MSDFDSDLFTKRLNEAIGKDSISEFAGKIGIGEDTAADILSGKTEVRSSITVRISSEYQVSLDWLLGLTDEKDIHQNEDEKALEAWNS